MWRLEDVLEVYRRPYDPQRPVVCVDEKSRQLLADARPPLPPEPGRQRRSDYEYQRHGTANVFVAFAPLANWRRLAVTQQRTKKDWASFIKDLVDGRYRQAERIVLVMDHLNTHSPASLYEAFAPPEARRIAEKLEIHYTPKHGSWLNMAEIEISVVERRLPERIADSETLAQACAAIERERNGSRATVDWRFTTADARIKLKRLYPSIELW